MTQLLSAAVGAAAVAVVVLAAVTTSLLTGVEVNVATTASVGATRPQLGATLLEPLLSQLRLATHNHSPVVNNHQGCAAAVLGQLDLAILVLTPLAPQAVHEAFA